MPAKILPPAIPAVILDEIPAKRRAIAKITDAPLPRRGFSIEPATARSSTFSPAAKKVEAILISEKCRVDRIESIDVDNIEEKIHEALIS